MSLDFETDIVKRCRLRERAEHARDKAYDWERAADEIERLRRIIAAANIKDQPPLTGRAPATI